jgi:hypothetical protein
MDSQDSELLGKIRQQFDFGPYPRIEIDHSPKMIRDLYTFTI